MSQYEIIDRLKRIETKVVRFAEELGVDTEANRDWLTADVANHVIYVSTLGRSLQVIRSEAIRKGVPDGAGKTYDIVHKGELVGTMDI